jgi:hypothetical protein
VLLISALFFWYDITYSLLPALTRPRIRVVRWSVFGLAAAAASVLVAVPNAFRGEVGNAVNIGQMAVELPFILYALYMLGIAAATLYNHNLLRRAGLGHKYRFFFIATLIIAANVVHGVFSLALLPPQSRLVQDGLILAAIIVQGYSAARHQTFVERRTTFRDFQVSGLAVLGMTAVFGLTGYRLGLLPLQIGVLVALAVLALGSYDFIRIALDGLFNRQVSRLRSQLMETARSAGAAHPVEKLGLGLKNLCDLIEAEGALIAAPAEGGFRVLASAASLSQNEIFAAALEPGHELIELEPGVPPGLRWIAPCSWQGETLAVVGIGPRRSGGAYTEGDLDLLTDFADHIALLLHLDRLQSSQTDRLAALAAQYHENEVTLQTGSEAIVERLIQTPDVELIDWVEDGLRNLADFSYLGRSPLVETMDIRGDTHLVRGQVMRERMLDLVDSLKPPGGRPPEPLPREWHSFAILHDAYIEGVPNNEIMARLYISQGTFHRTRRNAVRAIARSIQEIRQAG